MAEVGCLVRIEREVRGSAGGESGEGGGNMGGVEGGGGGKRVEVEINL